MGKRKDEDAVSVNRKALQAEAEELSARAERWARPDEDDTPPHVKIARLRRRAKSVRNVLQFGSLDSDNEAVLVSQLADLDEKIAELKGKGA